MNLDNSLQYGFPLPDSCQVTGITLSRTNLETLLSKLDTPGSACMILRQVKDRDDIAASPLVVIVKAEEDAEHYHARARQEDTRGLRGAVVEDGATRLGQVIEVAADDDMVDAETEGDNPGVTL